MHDVAERRRFDQQNTRELGGLKPDRVPVLNLCVLDLPVQFAKDKSARMMPLVKLQSATRNGHVFLFAWGSLFSVKREDLLETARPRAAFPLRSEAMLVSYATRASRLHLSS
jgi:hypothetical protein